MSKATEASISASRKKRQEQLQALGATRNTGAKTSSSVYHKSGLKRSSYKGSSYSQ